MAEFSLSPCGRGAGEGATPPSSSMPTTGWRRTRCPDLPLPSTPRRRASPPVGAYTFVGTSTVHTPPSGDILPTAAGAQPVRQRRAPAAAHAKRCARPEASSRHSPMARTGSSGSASRCKVRSPPHPVARRCCSSASISGSAYHRLATDPAAFAPCMDAIFANPALLARFGARRLAAIRRRTDAENHWIIGRELIRHGHKLGGLVRLHQSVRAHPSVKRACLLAIAHMLPLVPSAWRGPFCPYQFTSQAARTRTNFACSVPTSPCGRKMMNTTSRLP